MVGKVPLQKRRALALSILMIALAQTSYIGALQGWTFVERLSNDDANFSSNCGSATVGAGDPFHVDIFNGSDLWAGTNNCPKSSILSAVENASSNDEIIVHSGRYHENITIDNKDGLIVRAATGERVVLDGTQGISEDFDATWTSPDSDGIQEVTLPVVGWQLFLDWEEQVPARWPNAGFANDSVFNRSYWAEGTLTGTNNAYTNGWLQDAGPETGVHDGLNETINATGLDPVGAIAILNVGSFKSYSREITSWNVSTGTFGYDVTPSWKTKHHAYFLEGKRELIDVDGEWWFNNTNNRLHYRPTSGENANNLDLRVKVQPFAITIENSDDVTIQGIDFFGTTIDVNECDGCSFTNSTLEYPSTSRRGQAIADESEDDRFVTHFYRSTNTFVDRISITNTDGAAIEFHGAGGQSYNNVVNNSYFHAIDWSASDQKGLMTTIYEGGRDMTFSNNTVHLTGASSVLSIGDSPTVIYNEVWDVGHLQTDGAVVQLMQGEVEGSEIAYNWIHDIGKYGIRFDAPIGQSSTGNNGSIHHNVIWNASGGIMVKGDYHDISNNTVFGNQVDGKNNIIILHESNTGNENSSIWHNAADAIAAHRSNDWSSNPLQAGTYGNNWNGYLNASTQLGFEIEDPQTNSMQGVVSLNGNGTRVAVGAKYDYAYKGSAKVYEFTPSNDTWSQIGNGIYGAAIFEGVGASVALNETGDRMIVGAPGELSSSLHGVALMYEYTSSNDTWWQMGDNITAASSGIRFGSAVAINDQGNRVAIGDWANTVGGTQSGQVKLFEYSSLNNTWWQIGATFNGGLNDRLGYSISLNAAGDRIAISSPLDNGYKGATRIYQYSATNGTCWQIGSTIDGITNSHSGHSVSLDSVGNTLIIGEPGTTGSGLVGTARVFNYTASNDTWWQLGENITGTLNGATGNELGTHVDIDADGDTVAIGTPLQDASATNAGKVEVFRYSTSNDTWWQDGEDIDGFAAEAKYGHVSLNDAGTRLAVGTTPGTAINPVRIFSLPPENTQGIGYGPFVEAMLVDPDSQDFRPKVDSTLDQLDAGAYDAADSNPWDAGIEWSYTSKSKPKIGCSDSAALNYKSGVVFDDGSCRFIKADVSGMMAHLNQPITPITFTESLSNINTGNWTSGVSNSSNIIQTDLPLYGTDIALWSNGDIAIVYNRQWQTYSNKVLGLSIRSSGSWSHTVLENNTNTGYYPSIAIDKSGSLHISYLDHTNETLRYATNMSGNWVFTTLDNAKYTGTTGSETDIQIDSKGAIHIVYPVQVSSKRALNHTTNASGSWVTTTVTDTSKNSGVWPSLALDGNDFAHISVYRDEGSDIVYITDSNGSWTNETVETTNNVGRYSQIAVDSNDKIVIVYVRADGNNDIRWAHGNSGSWTKSMVATNMRASFLSLGIDSNDDVHLSMHNSNNKRIIHFTNSSGSWVQTSDYFGLSGEFAEMTIDDNDDIHISHSDTVGNSDLKYATFKGTGKGVKIQPIFSISPDLPKGLNFNWKTGEISGSSSELSTNTTYTVWVNGSGRSDSTSVWINVEENMRSSVSGLTATVNSLISPITFDWYSSIWETRVTNDSASPAGNDNQAGRQTDSAVDSNGKTHIVSFDDSNDDLRYSTNAGGSWSSSLIVQTGNTGRHPSIVIDSNDIIHVIFYDHSNTRLMYMNKSVSSSSWSSLSEIHSDAKNHPTGIALDDDDTLYVSWRRGDNTWFKQCFVRTKLATSTSWNNAPGLQTFYTSSGSGGGNENHEVRNACDVAVDSNKKIHIVVNDADKDLRYITNADGSWDAEDVRGYSSSSADTGRFVKLAIDSQDYVHITYAEASSGSNSKVYYEKKNPSTGSWSTREELSWYADYPAIAIDSHDYVHIIYAYTSSGDQLVYESNYGGGSIEFIRNIHTSGTDYLEPSIVVDNNDDIHVTAGYGNNKRLVSGTVIGTGNGIKDDAGSWRPVISTISSCEVSPSLPQGLSVNNQRCTLSGTPTELANNQTYTVWANTSSGDSFSTSLWLRVVPSAPAILYSPSEYNLTKGTSMSSSATPSNTGGQIPSHEIWNSSSNSAWLSSAIDSNDFTHVSFYNSGDLYYSTDQNGSWVTIAVNNGTSNVGEYNSIAVDSNDKIHISYWNQTQSSLMYSTNSGGSWAHSMIDNAGYVGEWTSIAIDSNDKVHISYYEKFGTSSNENLKYATNIGGSWANYTLESTNMVGSQTSIAIDSNNGVHIAYWESSNKDLKYINNIAGTWVNSTIDSTGVVGGQSSIVVDVYDNVHISYRDVSNSQLKYASNETGSWLNQSIDNSANVGQNSDLVIDSDGHLHISYRDLDGSDSDILYATNQSGSWDFHRFSIGAAVHQGSSIVVDSNDNVILTYVQNEKILKTITYTDDGYLGWSITPDLPTGLNFNISTGEISGTPTIVSSKTNYTVTARNIGGYSTTNINITVNDQLPNLSYSPENLTLVKNQTSSDLPLNATLTGPGAITSWAISPALPSGLTFETSNGTIWGTPTTMRSLRTYTIWANNSGGSVNATVNITVNDELPNISYSPDWFVLTNNTAMSPTATPTNTGGTLPSTTIDSSGNVGGYNSIALDSNGYRHVAYSGIPSGTSSSNLMYATDASGTWVSISLDSTGNVGTNPIIEIDSDDNIHITYLRTDSGNQGVKYATCSSSCSSVSSWTNSIIISAAVGWDYGVMSIDSNDDLHLIYYNGSSSSGILNYATCSSSCATASSWTNITIDGANKAGFGGMDLVIDSSDHLHVAYSLYSTRDLKYITCSSSCTSVSSWTNLSIDTVGDVGRMPSIEVDSNDDLHISYYNDTGGGLKYAWCSSSCTTASSWSNTTIANGSSYGTSSTLVGFYSDLAFDSDGHMHITHIDFSKRWLVYSTCSSSCSTNSSWSHSVLVSDYDVLNLQHLVIDSNDELNIVFYDNHDDDLEFMLLDASSQPYEYSISPDLPTGLSINPTTGTISGIPRELSTNTTYTITVRNSGGTNTTTITIEVLDQLPGLNISPENTTATNNTAISTITITTVGPGEIVTWELEGELPDGLTWTPANQTIWGTPTELMTTTQYTIWANNTGGDVSATLNITVNDEVPTTLSFSNPDILLTNNTLMTPLNPITTGPGVVVTWYIVGALPLGITFNSSTGILSGTPTELMTTTQYTIGAINSGGSIFTVVNITVVDQLPILTYPSISLHLTVNTVNSDIPFEPSLTGPGEIISWEMTGELPSGMEFNASTGILSGIPTELWTVTNYTVWANNTGGQINFTFDLTVVDQVPNEIGYSSVNLTLTNNTAMSPEQPSITGQGTITSWEINDELPDGITFNQSTGEISGTPTELWPITPYTVWANNSGGHVLVEFNLSVIAIEPSISYNSSVLSLTVGILMNPLESLSTGGVIASWEVYPELPDGLSIDSTSGHISGTPTTLQSPLSYTIWANNTGGRTTFEISISIIDIPASVDISPDSIVLTIGESMNPAQISVSGGQVIEWGIHPELPHGLLFDTTNLSITGIPSELIPETLYTIWANNSGGSQTTSIAITVIDIPPTIDYVDEHVFYSNVSEVLIEPIVSGGVILNYSLGSDLPNGLSFDFSNGSIIGIPSEISPRTQLIVTVSNSGGTSIATLNITILPSAGCMDSLAENYDPIAIVDSGLCVYTDTDGDGVADINEIEGCTNLDALNYQPTATDDDGSCIPRLSVIYPEYSIVLIVGQNNVSIVPEVLGQTVEMWSIEPSLPESLKFNYLVENGVLTAGKGSISGIPLESLGLSNYTIVAIDEDTNQTVTIGIYLQILMDTDGDGKPNVGTANWIEDLDDDDDGYLDSKEDECGSDPENSASIPDLDSEGNCAQEEVSDTEEPPIPETTANLYYWCILPLAIILAVMFFSLLSRQRHDEEENKDSELEEYNQPIELI